MLGTNEPWRRAIGRAEGVIEEMLADAKPTMDNEFKITLAERTLDAMLTQARGDAE
jgi:xanthine dehydrogenase YagS FAD-binding subunit